MPIGAWPKAETHYPARNLEFLTLKWAVNKKFHEYLYWSTFDVYTNNSPLTYILTMAKLDTASHHCVVSLANYNFQLYYRVGKTNIDVDALWRMLWPGCVPNTLGTHQWVTAVMVHAMQEAVLEGQVSPIETYSWNLHILDLVGDSWQVTCMTDNEWHQTQWADPVLSFVIMRMQDGTLGQHPLMPTDPPELQHFLHECNHLKLRKGVLYRKILPKESQEALFQLVLPAMHWETTLKGCHGEVCHLCLEQMLDLMYDHFFWPHMAA